MTVEEITLVNGDKGYHMIADEGMEFVRDMDGFRFGNELWLGYRYIDADHNILETPVLEVPEDYHQEVMVMYES